MYCLNCSKLLNPIITYKNIFKTNKFNLCERCLLNLTFDQRVEVVPINNYLLYINPIFTENNYEPLSLMNFIKPYIIFYLKNKFDLILYFDNYFEEVFHLLEKLNLGNIFLITINKKEKGE